MTCNNCGKQSEGAFCSNCGAQLFPDEIQVTTTPVTNEEQLPEQYKPLSPWAYFGLQLLFAVPIVGLVFLIIFSCKKSNINRRNFARSYWCSLIIVGVVLVIYIIAFVLLGASASAFY